MSIGIKHSMNKFAFLHVQDSSEDSDTAEQVTSHGVGNGKLSKAKLKSVESTGNAKKRSKRRRRKNKSTSSDPPAESDEKQMKEWIEHDQNLVDKLYDDDLKKAIELSKVDCEKLKTDGTRVRTMTVEMPHFDKARGDCALVKSDSLSCSLQRKEKKKNKPAKISLEAFHQRVENPPQSQSETLALSQEEQRVPMKDSEKTNFFDQVEKEALYIKRNDQTMQRFRVEHECQKNGSKTENREQDKSGHQGAEKDQLVEKLRSEISDWENRFKHVKKRNQQLLVMLQQGEMKDKSELLLEIDSLSVLRDELTQEVSNLNESLEQERSRSSKLKDELTKLQAKKSQDDCAASK